MFSAFAFLLLVPSHVSLPMKHCPGGSAAEAMFISASCVLSHGDWNTGMSSLKSQTVLAAHRSHPKIYCLFITRYYSLSTVDTTDLFSSYAGHVVDEPPHLSSRPQLLVNSALPVVYLKSDHSDEMELQPKVRSSLDATWILI